MKVTITESSGRITVYLDEEKLVRSYAKQSSRFLFFGKNHVVKLENKSQQKGLGQTDSEKALWFKNIKQCHKDYFVPLLKVGRCGKYKYVIQPRMKIKEAYLTQIDKKLKDEFFDVMESYNICDVDSDRNYGVLENGKLICYDYGV